MTTTIFVRFVGVGFHSWPDAPDHRAYLRAQHRHQFHVEARCAVLHDDREVEFHDVMDAIAEGWSRLGRGGGNAGSRSCEQIARLLAAHLAERWNRDWTVTVSEDGEAGATVVLPSG